MFSNCDAQVQPNRWNYAASKGAVTMLTKSMAYDMRDGRIRINSVAPAWVWSPECKNARPENSKKCLL